MAPAVAESNIVYNILNSEFVKYDYDRWIRFQTQSADDGCLPGGLDRLPERIPVRRVFSAQISAEQPASAASV